MPNDDTHGLEVVPPHALPNQLRTCIAGVLTQEEAQAHLDAGAMPGSQFRVLVLRPARCVKDDQLVDATEIIFTRVRV